MNSLLDQNVHSTFEATSIYTTVNKDWQKVHLQKHIQLENKEDFIFDEFTLQNKHTGLNHANGKTRILERAQKMFQ